VVFGGLLINQEYIVEHTEKGFAGYRSQIKQSIVTAKQPTAKDLKYETPVQTPKPTLPLPLVSQTISQTLLPPPKPEVSPGQLLLQHQLITACKQGDIKEVASLFKQGAKPDIADMKGEYPLGAAVWGMCPDVVNALLQQAGGVAPMTWKECETHNEKHYYSVFFVSESNDFEPLSNEHWLQQLLKIAHNPFLRAFHLNKANEQWHDEDTSSWKNLIKYVGAQKQKWAIDAKSKGDRWFNGGSANRFIGETRKGFAGFRKQIQQTIEAAKRPEVTKTF
jgi:hypothetical protein